MSTKQSVTKYEYIAFLVREIKRRHKENENFDWHFGEVVTLYMPLIYTLCKKLKKRTDTRFDMQEIREKIMEMMFEAILKYDGDFQYENSVAENFSQVYFSKYLLANINWTVYRVINPNKPDYDDFNTASPYVELDMKKLSEEASYVPKDKISKDFIAYCRDIQKNIKDDDIADTMMLYYGYDFKQKEIAKILNKQPKDVSVYLGKIKSYWLDNKEKLL